MRTENSKRFGLLFVAVLVAIPLVWSAPPEAKTEEFAGKVVPLADVLDKLGVKIDKDAAAVSLALSTGDGKTYLIVKDSGSRMFFKDTQLQYRPVVVTGRLVGDIKLLQILTVRTVVKGVRHEPYYWCDICKIKRFEPNACDCCGAALEFREVPVEN